LANPYVLHREDHKLVHSVDRRETHERFKRILPVVMLDRSPKL
jgi:hypothetical protein